MNSQLAPKIDTSKKGMFFLMNVRKDPLNYFTNLMQEGGDYVWFQIMNEKVLLLNDATGIEDVLRKKFKSFKKGKFYNVLKPLLGEGIFLAEQSLWKKQRKESLPVFSAKNYDQMIIDIEIACDGWMERLGQKALEDKPIEMNGEAMWFTLDVVLRALCHEEREGVAHDMNTSMKDILEEAEQRIWGAFLLPQSIKLRLPKYRYALEFINNLVSELVQKRFENQNHPNDLLSTLIQSYDKTQKEQRLLQDQIINFLLAGHETTANALSWFFYEISQRPEIKSRIINEIEAEIGDEKLTYNNINRLTYTKAAFQEALRLYPPVWTMSRTALEDVSLSLDNGDQVFVPANTSVMLCSYAVHRREKYWDNPCAFDPDRFLNDTERPACSYFPFSYGHRLCVGHKFALIEALVAITKIFKTFDLTLTPGQNIKPDPIITLRPNAPLLFSLKKRGANTSSLKLVRSVKATEKEQCPLQSAVNNKAQNS